jgi:hypothetical protein
VATAPKLGGFVWRLRCEDDGRNPVFVGVQKLRIVAWDDENLMADTNTDGNGWSCLHLLPREGRDYSEQHVTDEAHRTITELKAKGKQLNVDPDLKSST